MLTGDSALLDEDFQAVTQTDFHVSHTLFLRQEIVTRVGWHFLRGVVDRCQLSYP